MTSTDEADEALVEQLADLFMPEQAMGLDESEDLGRKVFEGVRAYCLGVYPALTTAQVQDLARRVKRRIEWRLSDKRRRLPKT